MIFYLPAGLFLFLVVVHAAALAAAIAAAHVAALAAAAALAAVLTVVLVGSFLIVVFAGLFSKFPVDLAHAVLAVGLVHAVVPAVYFFLRRPCCLF